MGRLDGKVALITGGARGMGKSHVRHFVSEGARVVFGDVLDDRGTAVAAGLGEQSCRYVHHDVTSEADWATAVAVAMDAFGALDVLVNNAGIAGGRKPIDEVTADDLESVFATNVFGIVRVTQAFLPLLAASARPAVVVNVSSGLGSVGRVTDPGRLESSVPALAYTASKSAVNMLTVQYAKAFPDFRINVVDPGYTATDLNGHQGTQSIEEGAEIIVRMALIGADGPTGGYFAADGPVPW
jgi:NAD(P)-dependent dehydrogenase (short-subunit alcohol dehydrogenase family)